LTGDRGTDDGVEGDIGNQLRIGKILLRQPADQDDAVNIEH
jgi:hypothetical protein